MRRTPPPCRIELYTGALSIRSSASYEASSQKFFWGFEGKRGEREAFGCCLRVLGSNPHIFPTELVHLLPHFASFVLQMPLGSLAPGLKAPIALQSPEV